MSSEEIIQSPWGPRRVAKLDPEQVIHNFTAAGIADAYFGKSTAEVSFVSSDGTPHELDANGTWRPISTGSTT